ncbi:hypothetical protein O181_103551, partial [Austropuccinia psidii MF-1]|nr:hypothetical protein [Austropuccinia psidii MF-1]
NCPGDSPRSPHATPDLDTSSNLQIYSEADASSSTPPLSEQITSTSLVTSSLPNVNRNPFAKGWINYIVPVKGPQRVDSNISNKNILSGGQ